MSGLNMTCTFMRFVHHNTDTFPWRSRKEKHCGLFLGPINCNLLTNNNNNNNSLAKLKGCVCERCVPLLRPYGVCKCWWVECIRAVTTSACISPAFAVSMFQMEKRDSETKIKHDLNTVYCVTYVTVYCNSLLELIKTNV